MTKYRRCVSRRNSGRSIEFSLVFETASGDLLTSPPLPDVTQVHETALRISRLLRLPDPEPAENPLDAVNAGIRLGKPSNPKRVLNLQDFLVVLLACALSVPFIHALWYDKLSPFGIAVWSLGAIVAFVLLRYLHRMSACWIVHDGAIRIEWLSLKGTTEVETIGGHDVEAIDVESGGRKDSLYVIINPTSHRDQNPQSGAGRQGSSPRRAG